MYYEVNFNCLKRQIATVVLVPCPVNILYQHLYQYILLADNISGRDLSVSSVYSFANSGINFVQLQYFTILC